MELAPLGLTVLLAVTACDAANILAVIWLSGSSHFVMFERLFKELAARGHNVTVLNHFPQKTPVANYTDISIAGSLESYEEGVSLELVEEINTPLGFLNDWSMVIDMCKDVYRHPKVQQLVQSEDHYDLVIAEVFYPDCMVAIAHKFQTPLIGITSSMAMPWGYDRMGNPDNPAYMESFSYSKSAPFSFLGRFQNTFWYFVHRLGDWFGQFVVDRLATEVFGADVPPTSDVVRNTSLMLVNSHWSTGSPIPTVPGLVEVGGLHVKEPKPLPKDLKKFLDDSPDGVVYFSLGTMVRSDTFAPDKLKAVLDVFSELPQRVLWKVDPSKLPALPPNVMARKWIPQNDVLNHPKVRVFITHSGLMGTQEAVAAGVPMLAIPMFGDQFHNADRVVAKGNGVMLLYQDISLDSLRRTLEQLLNTSRYRERARQLSVLFRDRPRPPLEEAVYWVEYVLRHRGAPHLRSAALDLAWYQYLLLDVAAFVLAVTTSVVLAVYVISRKIIPRLLLTMTYVTARKQKTS